MFALYPALISLAPSLQALRYPLDVGDLRLGGGGDRWVARARDDDVWKALRYSAQHLLAQAQGIQGCRYLLRPDHFGHYFDAMRGNGAGRRQPERC